MCVLNVCESDNAATHYPSFPLCLKFSGNTYECNFGKYLTWQPLFEFRGDKRAVLTRKFAATFDIKLKQARGIIFPVVFILRQNIYFSLGEVIKRAETITPIIKPISTITDRILLDVTWSCRTQLYENNRLSPAV